MHQLKPNRNQATAKWEKQKGSNNHNNNWFQFAIKLKWNQWQNNDNLHPHTSCCCCCCCSLNWCCCCRCRCCRHCCCCSLSAIHTNWNGGGGLKRVATFDYCVTLAVRIVAGSRRDLFHFRAADVAAVWLHCLWGNNKIKWQTVNSASQPATSSSSSTTQQQCETFSIDSCGNCVNLSGIDFDICFDLWDSHWAMCGQQWFEFIMRAVTPQSNHTATTTARVTATTRVTVSATCGTTTATRATPCHVLTTLNFHFMRSLCN